MAVAEAVSAEPAAPKLIVGHMIETIVKMRGKRVMTGQVMARNFMLRREVSEMLTAVCILMCQMRQMVPVPMVGQTAAVAVESMDATSARCVVSKTMATVTTVASVTSVTAAMSTVASTSNGQGNRSQR